MVGICWYVDCAMVLGLLVLVALARGVGGCILPRLWVWYWIVSLMPGMWAWLWFGLCDFLWVDPLVGCVFLLPHWFVWLLKPELWAVLWFFPMPGLWACVISGRFAWFPCLWGLVVVLVIGSSKLRIIWWFYIGLIPLFL